MTVSLCFMSGKCEKLQASRPAAGIPVKVGPEPPTTAGDGILFQISRFEHLSHILTKTGAGEPPADVITLRCRECQHDLA